MTKKKNTNKSISGKAVSVMFVVSFLLCITIVVQVLFKGYASLGGYSLFIVVTGSMEPTIPTGALLLCDSMDIEDIVEGDIVCFRSPERYMKGSVITHRVYDVKKESNGDIHLYTKGDANISIDGYIVKEEHFIGRVSWYTRKDGFFINFIGLLSSRYGFLSCIVFPVLIVSSIIIRDCTKSIMKDLEQANAELDEREKEYVPQQDISAEEYKEMYDRIKAELLGELASEHNSKLEK